MESIFGIVHNGQIIPETSVDWPNGTKVDIRPHAEAGKRFGLDESEMRDDASSLADWDAWLKTIEPGELTPEEKTQISRFREEMRQFNVEAVRRQMEGETRSPQHAE